MVLGEHAQRPHRRQETLSAVSPLSLPLPFQGLDFNYGRYHQYLIFHDLE